LEKRNSKLGGTGAGYGFGSENKMQWIKIQIPDRDECTKAFAAMIRRGRVDCYRDNVFVVPEPALQLLGDMEVHDHELGRGSLDYAQKALRDSSAAPA
jgi:hypothetical protein